MSAGNFIQGILLSVLPEQAHGIVAKTNVSLGGSLEPANVTFTQAYSFVVPLCATMGAFCVLLIVFIGICVWAECTYESPDDGRPKKDGGRETEGEGEAGQWSEDFVSGEEEEEEEEGGGEAAVVSKRRSLHSKSPSRKQSALFNMDTSVYKQTSSTAPSFRKPPGKILGDRDAVVAMGRPSLDATTMRRRSSLASGRSQPLNDSFESSPKKVALFSPRAAFNGQHQPPPPLQQQVHKQQGRSGRSSVSSGAKGGIRDGNGTYSNGDFPAHASTGRLPPRPNSKSSKSSPQEVTIPQQQLRRLSNVNPLAPLETSSKMAPSMRRHGGDQPPARSGSRPRRQSQAAPSERQGDTAADSLLGRRHEYPRSETQQQHYPEQQRHPQGKQHLQVQQHSQDQQYPPLLQLHQQPMSGYDDAYGGYAMFPADGAGDGNANGGGGSGFVHNHGNQLSNPERNRSNRYAYAQEYAQGSPPSDELLPHYELM